MVQHSVSQMMQEQKSFSLCRHISAFFCSLIFARGLYERRQFHLSVYSSHAVTMAVCAVVSTGRARFTLSGLELLSQ